MIWSPVPFIWLSGGCVKHSYTRRERDQGFQGKRIVGDSGKDFVFGVMAVALIIRFGKWRGFCVVLNEKRSYLPSNASAKVSPVV